MVMENMNYLLAICKFDNFCTTTTTTERILKSPKEKKFLKAKETGSHPNLEKAKFDRNFTVQKT